MLTVQELIDFEDRIAAEFNAGHIRAPIHLSKGNEEQLIEIFKNYRKGDWVFSTWRSHLHALLAGIPPEEVKCQIMAGRSMTVCSPDHNFFASAIVAGCCPIALGVAWAIKNRGGNEKVFLFIGDMTAYTGLAMECDNYAKANNLPLFFVIEDNGKSVCSNTQEVMGPLTTFIKGVKPDYYYKWDLSKHWPHSGAGKRIQF